MTELFYPTITEKEHQEYLTKYSEYKDVTRKLIVESLGFEPDLAISFLPEIHLREAVMKHKQGIISNEKFDKYRNWYCNIIRHVTENGTDEPDPGKRLMRGLIYQLFTEGPELRRLQAEKEAALANNRRGFPETANGNLRPGAADLKPYPKAARPAKRDKNENAIKFEDLGKPKSCITPDSQKWEDWLKGHSSKTIT